MKRCYICKAKKTESEFHKDRSKPDGFNSRCKSCNTVKQSLYTKRIKKEFGRTRARAYELKHYYGIMQAEYDSMLKAQNGVCAICKTKPENTLAVDHCHDSKSVRGLLCRRCNSAIGLFDEDLGKLSAAMDYIIHWHQSRELAALPEIKHTYKCECDLCVDRVGNKIAQRALGVKSNELTGVGSAPTTAQDGNGPDGEKD